MRPIIKQDAVGRWWCITRYTISAQGIVMGEEAYEISDRIGEIIKANLVHEALDAPGRRN